MIYEETARNLEYQIICSHCFNWGVRKNKGHGLLLDKTRSPVTQPIKTVFTYYKWGALFYPAYIPDMSSTDFYVFTKMN